MRLITHNMLKCSVRGVEKGYPLKITAETVENVPAEFNAGEYNFDAVCHLIFVCV